MNKGIYNEFWGDYMIRDEHGKPLYDSRFDPAMGHWTQYRPDDSLDLSVIMNVSLDSDEAKNNSNINIDVDMFSDDNIDNTVKEYNYDYGRLVRMLTTMVDSSLLEEIIGECELETINIINPTKETFEVLRQRIINGNTKNK